MAFLSWPQSLDMTQNIFVGTLPINTTIIMTSQKA